jgi:hypothetical protein
MYVFKRAYSERMQFRIARGEGVRLVLNTVYRLRFVKVISYKRINVVYQLIFGQTGLRTNGFSVQWAVGRVSDYGQMAVFTSRQNVRNGQKF